MSDAKEKMELLCDTTEEWWLARAEENSRKLVRLVNHPETQELVNEHLAKVRKGLEELETLVTPGRTSTLFAVLKKLRKLVDELQVHVLFDPKAISSFVNRPLLSYVLDDFSSDLFDESKPARERVLAVWDWLDPQRLAEREEQRQERARANHQEHLRRYRSDVRMVKQRFEEGLEEHDKSMDAFLNSLKTQLRGLEEQLRGGQERYRFHKTAAKTEQAVGAVGSAAGAAAFGAVGLLVGACFVWASLRHGNEADNRAEREGGKRFFARQDPDWMDNVLGCVFSYLRGETSELDIQRLIAEEQLEEDMDKIAPCVRSWLDVCNQKLVELPRLEEDDVVNEVRRGWAFVRALILNDERAWERHTACLERLVNESGSGAPMLSTGRLGGSGVVRMRVVVEPGQVAGVEQYLRDLAKSLSEIVKDARIVHCAPLVEAEGREVVIEFALHDGKAQELATAVASRLAELARIHAKCVLLGDFGVSAINVLNPRFNRIYGNGPAEPGYMLTGNFHLVYGGKRYFPPVGWKRISLFATETGTPSDFDKKYGGWHVAYHGTHHFLTASILGTGLRAQPGAGSNGQPVVYVSPSIVYASHHRYARVYKHKGKFVQMVLQLRVNPKYVSKEGEQGGTLEGSFPPGHSDFNAERDGKAVDPNFPDNQALEWLIQPKANEEWNLADMLVIYGIMVRETETDPHDDPNNAWWAHCPCR